MQKTNAFIFGNTKASQKFIRPSTSGTNTIVNKTQNLLHLIVKTESSRNVEPQYSLESDNEDQCSVTHGTLIAYWHVTNNVK